MVVAGDLDRLQSLLQHRERITVVAGRRYASRRGAHQIVSWVERLAPHARIMGMETASLRDVLEAPIPLPVQRENASSQRPRYMAAGTRVRPGALPSSDAADLVLIIDDADLDAELWHAMPARSVGSCDPAVDRMALAQEQTLSHLEPFLDHADALAAGIYRNLLPDTVANVAAALESQGEVGAARTSDEVAALNDGCGRAYRAHLQVYERCVDSSDGCPMAPRMYLVGGVRFGSVVPPVAIPEGCADTMGRDPVAELHEVARESARITAEALDPIWVARADRAASLAEVYGALEDACWPRRRRFAPEDVAEARRRLERVGQYVASDEPPRDEAHWLVSDDSFHVPGLGTVRQLVRHVPGDGSPGSRAVAEGRALREFLLSRARCNGGRGALPRAVAAVDVARGDVAFFGYLYDEELSCGELGPLFASGPG